MLHLKLKDIIILYEFIYLLVLSGNIFLYKSFHTINYIYSATTSKITEEFSGKGKIPV